MIHNFVVLFTKLRAAVVVFWFHFLFLLCVISCNFDLFRSKKEKKQQRKYRSKRKTEVKEYQKYQKFVGGFSPYVFSFSLIFHVCCKIYFHSNTKSGKKQIHKFILVEVEKLYL